MSLIYKTINEAENSVDTQTLKQQLEQAKKGFDPNFEYSDDHSYWTKQNEKAKLIRSLEKQLKNTDNKLDERKNYTSSILTEQKIYKLWENAGNKIMEAQLTADQIQQLFQQVQDLQTASGDNRTMLGKGKDAAQAVSKAWTDLKDKVYNSKPMTNFAASYDKAAEQLKQATGGDQGAMKYIQKYRDFATKHPMLQSAVYAALIAAAGISGVGLGGAAALGLFKLLDQALQGKDIRSAMWSGVKTGATAYAAGQIGQALKGQPPPGSEIGSQAAQSATSGLNTVRQQAGNEALKAVQDAIANGANPQMQGQLSDIAQSVLEKYSTLNGGPLSVQTTETLAQKIAAQAASSVMKESTQLSESQIYSIFKYIDRLTINEGVMDTLKGAAGKAIDYAKKTGTNLTTKVTADKLMKAWKKAGSPTDSDAVAKILQGAGVGSNVVTQAMTSVGVSEPKTTNTTTTPTDASISNEPTSNLAGTTSTKAPTVYKQVKDLLGQLDKRSKQRIIMTLKKDLQLAESGHRMSVYEILCELQLEGKKSSKEIDYDDPKWDAMVKRVGQMAKEGPRKTVYDPVKKVYKTVPVNPPKYSKGVSEVSDTTKQSYKSKAQAQVKELEPHAKKGEYKDIAQRAIDRRQQGLARVK